MEKRLFGAMEECVTADECEDSLSAFGAATQATRVKESDQLDRADR